MEMIHGRLKWRLEFPFQVIVRKVKRIVLTALAVHTEWSIIWALRNLNSLEVCR